MEDQMKRNNFDKICRLCLEYASESTSLLPVFINKDCFRGYYGRFFEEFKESIPEIISTFIGIDIDPTDKLPMGICRACEKQLIASNKFRHKCLASNKYLQELKRTSEDDNEYDTEDDEPLMPPELILVDNIKEENNDRLNDYDMDSSSCDSVWNNFDTNKHVFNNDSQKESETRRHDEETKICTVCGIMVKNLPSHMKTHQDALEHSCAQCPRKYLTKQGLIRHMTYTHVQDDYEEAVKETVPEKSWEKSQTRYLHAYDGFVNWQKSSETTSFAETVMLGYFAELSKTYKPSSLWSRYSMLKSTILSIHGIDISGYNKLITFLKKKGYGFKVNRSKMFTADEVNKFLVEAPDDRYLVMKTVLVFGITGVFKGNELTDMRIQYVKDYGKEIILSIPQTKTKDSKLYSISERFAEIVRKYIQLRPAQVKTDRFFLQYRDGKCSIQVLGKNNFCSIPKEIAKFLQITDFESYTAQSFRLKSTTILADTGGGIESLKHHGQWKSSTVAEGYKQESIQQSLEIGNLITEAISSPSSSNAIFTSQPQVTSTITSSQLSISNGIVASQSEPDYPCGLSALSPGC